MGAMHSEETGLEARIPDQYYPTESPSTGGAVHGLPPADAAFLAQCEPALREYGRPSGPYLELRSKRLGCVAGFAWQEQHSAVAWLICRLLQALHEDADREAAADAPPSNAPDALVPPG
jgi:hypothetical protein